MQDNNLYLLDYNELTLYAKMGNLAACRSRIPANEKLSLQHSTTPSMLKLKIELTVDLIPPLQYDCTRTPLALGRITTLSIP
jgi:hypothetical protein